VWFQKLTRNFSPYTGTTYTVSSSNCTNFSCATNISLLMLTAGPRGQFQRWRRSRKRLSVCSVLRCPDLWLQCSVSFVHDNHRFGHLKTEHTERLFLPGPSYIGLLSMNIHHVTHLAPRILIWILDICKICSQLSYFWQWRS